MIATGLQPFILALLAASPPGGAAAPRLISTVDFSALNAYASSWERYSVTSFPEASKSILNKPAIIAKVEVLRQRLLDRWLSGGSAVNKDQLFGEALTLTSDPGSALILCYHVCQMFARGFETVLWQRVRDWETWHNETVPDGVFAKPTGGLVQPLDYTDGIDFYRPVELNAGLPGEVLVVGGHTSIFYLLFDKTEEWGTDDPGDWYHFFLMASVAYYAATGRTTDLDSPETVHARFISALVRSLLQGMQSLGQMPAVPLLAMNPYDAAWLWANAMSFVEGGFWGEEAAGVVTHESDVHRKGCLYGLQVSGETHHPDYLHWWVPTPGQLTTDFGLYFAQYHPIDVYDMRASLAPNGEFWLTLDRLGFNDPGIQGFLDLLRSQGPTSGRAACVLDGATGAVLSQHPVAGHL
jgi:hypothetical protein